ncbi:hypothetical protein BDQ17DRAFT_1426490 [Cyathus striatus]|nr:hypothetical protein BDQ17DRAFT_1426490 [Cyathus striatus]
MAHHHSSPYLLMHKHQPHQQHPNTSNSTSAGYLRNQPQHLHSHPLQPRPLQPPPPPPPPQTQSQHLQQIYQHQQQQQQQQGFNVAQAVTQLQTTANTLLGNSLLYAQASPGRGGEVNAVGMQGGQGFKAPAHKHAHHLHSIPPREKSTRTLIIDHMLWVHGRTRLSQARAELGMTDLTGGPTSPQYTHRTRPENYEEEDECPSESESLTPLLSRSGPSGPQEEEEEEERRRRQDLSLARGLRLRAEGLERVVVGMLEQKPVVLGPQDEGMAGSPPASPVILPGAVRLRLALGTIVNDLFARQAPTPPYRHTRMKEKGTGAGGGREEEGEKGYSQGVFGMQQQQQGSPEVQYQHHSPRQYAPQQQQQQHPSPYNHPSPYQHTSHQHQQQQQASRSPTMHYNSPPGGQQGYGYPSPYAASPASQGSAR